MKHPAPVRRGDYREGTSTRMSEESLRQSGDKCLGCD